MNEIMQLYKQLLMKKGFYNKPKIRKPILSPYNPDSQMVISETELYKPLINRRKRTKHSVQQKLYIMRGTAGNPTALLRSWQRQFVFDDLA